MRRISISTIAILIFLCFGCNKDSIIDPAEKVSEIVLTADTAAISQQLPGTAVSLKDSVLFEFKDFDNNIYHAILIGDQIWSRENLKTIHYKDGTPIPCVPGTTEWTSLGSGAYCHYGNLASNSGKYGLLYNVFAAASENLAPEGWHVATYDDWKTLMVQIGNRPYPYIGDVGALVNPADWGGPFYNIFDQSVDCTNSTGFSALPNGYRDISIKGCPEFDCLGYQSSWWALSASRGVIIYLDQWFGTFSLEDRPAYAGSGIRLVKDAGYNPK